MIFTGHNPNIQIGFYGGNVSGKGKSVVVIRLDKVFKSNTIIENEAGAVIGVLSNSDDDELKCPPEYTQAKADFDRKQNHCISYLNTAIDG